MADAWRETLCDQTVSAQQFVEGFVLRGHLEVTFHAARTHLGVETQRQWPDHAIACTTPALLGLLSRVTLCAQQGLGDGTPLTHQTAWYAKPLPTFTETLAGAHVGSRPHLWPIALSETSSANPDVVQTPRVLLARVTDTLAFVAWLEWRKSSPENSETRATRGCGARRDHPTANGPKRRRRGSRRESVTGPSMTWRWLFADVAVRAMASARSPD